MDSEQAWQAARQRFVEHDAAKRAHGRASSTAGTPVPDETHLGPLAAQFVALARDLFTVPAESGVVGVLERVVQRASRLVPDAAVVSLTLREADGEYQTPVETDPLATRADHIQYETGEGPCVEATSPASSGYTESTDLAHDERYPRFGPRVAELGLAAVCSTGMFPGGDPPRLGALNYYFHDKHALGQIDRDAALVLAAHSAVALGAARGLEAQQLRNAQLTVALQSRDVIGQAKGILMERRGVSADEAFDILRKASQDLNIKLHDIAETISVRHAEL